MRVLRLPTIRLIFSVMELCSEEQLTNAITKPFAIPCKEGVTLRAVLNFQEFLSDEENTVNLIGFRSGSVSLWGL